jgi:HEAT repeat protein
VLRKLFSIALALFALAAPLRADEDPQIGGKKVSEWFKFLRDEPDARRRQAVVMLIDSRAGPKVSVVFPGFVKELREHPDVAVRAKIVELLPKYKDKGDDVTTAIRAALTSDKDAKVRTAAVVALGKLDRMGFSGVPDLTAALKDKDAGPRAAAAEALGDFSRIDAEIARDAIPALTQAVSDPETSVRLQAAFAIGRMGAVAESSVPTLAAALAKEKDLAVRKEIVKSLGGMGTAAAPAASAILKLLHDDNAEIRQAAALGLSKIGPEASTALPELLKAARDRDKSVRCHAIHAIGSLGKPAMSAIPELIEILRKDEVADVRVAAIEELAAFGPDAKAAIDALNTAARDGRPAIREAAQEALKKIQQSP